MKNKKVVIITNIPNPYRIPLFNQINFKLAEIKYKFIVIFGAKGYARRKWEVDLKNCLFEYEVLNSKKLVFGHGENTMFLYSGIFSKLIKIKPNIVIVGGFSIATLKIVFLSKLLNYKIIIWSGAINTKGRKDSILRKLFRKFLLKFAFAFIAYGNKAREYLEYLGADSNKIYIGINSTDTKYFKTETDKIRLKKIDISSEKKLLYVGHFTYKKRIDLILHALKKLIEIRTDIRLILVGEGPYKTELVKIIADLNIQNYVLFEEFKQKEQIPEYLAEASCFLFPSEYDVWGLVLVEAMSAGVPCISSIHAGATHDLIIDGITGFAMDFDQSQEIADKINFILNERELAKTLAANAQRHIAEHASIEKSASGFIKAIIAAE